MTISKRWLTCAERRPNAKVRLFCFPYAGGAASVFHAWSHGLPPAVEVCSVQTPGRESRMKERPFARLKPLVEAISPELTPYLDKPFAFFGHSLGARMCFEVARQLRRMQIFGLTHLFASASYAPQLPDPPLHDLSDSEFLKEITRFNGIPEEALKYPEPIELILPTLRADCEANETYVYSPEPPLTHPISVFGGVQDRDVSQEALEPWRDQTNSPFSLQMFPGDHFFINTAQPQLLQAISQKLSI